MLCYAMSCYVKLCYVMLCYGMLCYVLPWYVMLCYVTLCHAMLCYAMFCYAINYVMRRNVMSRRTKLHLQRRKKESSENLKRDLRFSFKIDPTSWKFQNSNVLHLQQKLHFWWDMKLCRIWTQILFVGKERRFGFSELWIQIMRGKSCRFCFLELLASSVTKSLWWGIPKTVLVSKHGSKMDSKTPFGSILGRSWKDLGRIWGGFGKEFWRIWTFLLRFWSDSGRIWKNVALL